MQYRFSVVQKHEICFQNNHVNSFKEVIFQMNLIIKIVLRFCMHDNYNYAINYNAKLLVKRQGNKTEYTHKLLL